MIWEGLNHTPIPRSSDGPKGTPELSAFYGCMLPPANRLETFPVTRLEAKFESTAECPFGKCA